MAYPVIVKSCRASDALKIQFLPPCDTETCGLLDGFGGILPTVVMSRITKRQALNLILKRVSFVITVAIVFEPSQQVPLHGR